MKIDFIIGSLTGGGAERVLVLLANYFVENGHTVRIITFYDGDAYELDSRISRVRLHGGKIKNHKIRSLKNLIGFYRIKDNRPNVIISFITQTNLVSIIVAKIYDINIIVSEHNSYLRAQHPKYLTNFTRTFLYPLANYLTVLTSFDIEYYKKKKVNVVVMPNPCSFAPIVEHNKTKDKTILAIGNLDRYHHKGFDNLLTLIAPVLHNHKDWTLKIIGGGEKGLKFLTKLVNQHNIQDQVIFTGFRKDVNQIMQRSEVFILSSRYEGLPMVLLEAMSQGMACIAYDCKTGPADIIENGKNGLLIEDQNSEAMQKELSKLLHDNALRNKLRNHAVQSLNRFSMENIGQQWEQIFSKLPIRE
ncbi:glycosyltransferase family 4 protein [Arenibacter aquaticus]|uniref:Glycosyltransferase family 4 protein n=1 Tax=Arenibacter aquaticus TaxID=2489054 RepID=A0A3S0D613_9FLAO|nr:glycosyltransferase family 4 protein [Arenibacter aquaticus]RTE53801.1 glycosyltransferase family 4 protein [Arenibacter aquaticus]